MATPLDQQPHHEKRFRRQSSTSIVVVIVPFPDQGHMNQLLEFSHVLSSYDIPVHYVRFTLHNSQVKSQASFALHHLTKIQFHDFPAPRFPSSPPNQRVTKTEFLKSRLSFLKAITSLRKPIAALFRSLSPTARRLVVVYDTLMTSVVKDVFSLPNAEAYSFDSASALSCFAFTCDFLRKNENFPVKNLPSGVSCFPYLFRKFIADQMLLSKISKAGSLFNSCSAIEGPFLQEILANDKVFGKKKTWAVGPLLQSTKFKELRDQDKFLFELLDKQERNSVLYISFGITTTLSDEEIKELALGLELSGVKFLWVLKDADEANMLSNEEAGRPRLPDGFEERMKGMGMVVRECVNQMEILGHPSIGGFMSHCGWNSCVESISMGVPIAAWPTHSDQPINAALITEVLKVGVAVMEWRQRDELVTSSMIAEAARKLMASEEGDEIRKRTEAMSKAVNSSVSKGGDSRLEWDSFVAHITREGFGLKLTYLLSQIQNK
ncbi:UDP-glucuronosyl/UDP-glucosyltransferase [Trema orientale]|uniref:UDP-glucuronosyl/UDP-glucosyltransferase n=1 Tax=Trema orientale TaxID=63057 RepID=A0A2P5EXS6_TREOI|nr:UDP-glucuronosyl/UDP-glucosyltransferase [Trema orientale]